MLRLAAYAKITHGRSTLQLALMCKEGFGNIINSEAPAPEAVGEDATAAQKRAYAAEKKDYKGKNDLHRSTIDRVSLSDIPRCQKHPSEQLTVLLIVVFRVCGVGSLRLHQRLLMPRPSSCIRASCRVDQPWLSSYWPLNAAQPFLKGGQRNVSLS